MSDKSFGDHMSRGIVKNPLLSTAVTGLSIEDLTHNAVLLPVSRTSELFGRQEPEPATLAQVAHDPYPSGDATFTPIHPPNDVKDDFDVNEYFARLQGTRYVSAPINSHIEDSNANLDKEENLEEINLNEPEDIQHVPSGITADIAQNFSQLPTVLPQVASAVFSSFSNMLSMKREHTPEKRETQDAPVVGVSEREVPLMGASEREVAPPPREPPISGPGNFRLTTKKKYAQIPGLSSGESSQMPTYTPPTFNQPIFTPQPEFINNTNETNIPTIDVGQTNVNFNVFNNNIQTIPVNTQDNQNNLFQTKQDIQTNVFEKQEANYAATSQSTQETNAQAIIPPPLMFSNVAKIDSLPNVGKTILPPSVARRIGSNKPTISSQAPAFAAVGNIFVPPPVDQTPTTTYAQQSVPGYQTNPATSFPSTYSSQSSQSLSLPIPPTNTTSSTVPPATLSAQDVLPSSSSHNGSSVALPTGYTSSVSPFNTGNLPPPPKHAFNPPMSSQASSSSIPSAETTCKSAPQQSFMSRNPQYVVPPPMFLGSPMAPSIPQSANPLLTNVPPVPIYSAQQPLKSISPTTQASTNIPLFSDVPSVPMASTSAPPLMFPVNPMVVNEPPPTNVPLINVPATSASVITAPPKLNHYLQDQPTPGFQAQASTQISSQPTSHHIADPPKHDEQIAQIVGVPTTGPPKIPEPPKAAGNTNFRMTKKRPQYYSGPIEGVGAISNNVKPTLNPVAPPTFQGAVFTPEAVTGYQPAVFTPENVTEDVSAHGAVLTTENITEHQKQFSMFAPIGIDVNTSASQYLSDSAGATYTTSFDLSRHTTDSYEPPKQESAFGIIGSLKSKLSSIDINKLQNSVTTFFDPGYNVKTETTERNQPNYEQNQGIEMFVPNPETHPQPYNYDTHQTSFTYGQGSVPNASEYYNQQVHNMYSTNSFYSQPSYGTQSYSHTDVTVQDFNHYSNINNKYPAPDVEIESSQIANAIPCEHKTTEDSKDNAVENKTDTNFEVSYEFNESFGIVSVDSGKADDLVPLSQVEPEKNEPDVIKSQEENVRDAFKTLQINDDSNSNVQYFTLTKEQINANCISSPFTNEIGEFSDTMFRGTGFVDVLDHTKNVLMEEHKTQIDRMYSAPLDELSSMIADRSKEIFDGVSEGGTSWSNEEEVDDQSAAERLNALDSDSEDEERQSGQPDLNTCEAYGEENQSEHNDLTHQLIKNITAPIQLSNPVEVPLTENQSTAADDFDTINHCAQISLIADETIETLQIQSATELLNDSDDKNTETSYGWRTEAPLPLGQDLLDHDYNLKPNPSAIGFLGNNKLFFDDLPDYSSDMKSEFNQIIPKDETPLVLQREMSIPTAPPAEDSDDAKSDETGVLDVQSIEQDASKDFPVFEEYVIEPSEIDDEKIDSNTDKIKEVRNKNDEVKDTFTNRVDRFKQLEGNDDAAEQKDPNLSNPHTMMPSYFDTGNYAAESHFKNSLASPTIARIPPGFEDYDLLSKDPDKHYEPIKVPDTSTQTRLTTSISVAHTKTENLTSTVFSNMSTIRNSPAHIQESQTEQKLPDFASVFGAKIELKDTSVTEKTEVPTKDLPINTQAKIEEKTQEDKVTLPDPINFFASTQETDATESVNRLASYFSTPPKNDNTKSFFELSQGQDHYRHKEDSIKGNKSLESTQSQNISNIPPDRYIANINLMNDLTSIQNIEPSKEQIVRTVNYFTVEYDNDNLNFHRGEPSLNFKQPDVNKNDTEKEENIPDDTDLTEIVNKCKYCRDLTAAPVFWFREAIDIGRVRFRQAMNAVDTSSPKEVNMETAREGERSVNVRMEDIASDGDNSEGVAMLTENRSSNEYEPVKHHWFYRVDCEEKSTWRGFSNSDSRAIENAFHSSTLNENTVVPTDGGRYDVNVVGRLRLAVYWSEKPTNVRRCSWFYKGTTDARYVPYTEHVAEKLEVEYRHGITTGEWHRRLVLPNSELVVMHGPAVMVHFLQGGTTDAFSAPNLFTFGKRVYRNPPKFKIPPDLHVNVDHLLLLVHGAGEWKHQRDKMQSTMRPRVVRRGTDESEIEDSEPSSIDHLLLMCHGVGSACDMRFRAVEEVVDDFRATSLQLLQSHYRNSCDNGIVGRVEVLPISWHASLHSGPKGVDRRLARVTLASIPRLRSFTNDTVLDVLFYTSPHYCQVILDTVCGELNRIYSLFVSRNPDFKGRVSLGGHSLGSVILYDLLCNQPIPRHPEKVQSEKTYISGTAAHNPVMRYPKLCFEPLALYALGSPIAIFECIRGVESLGSDFCLPTCRNFFNIFHPYDPIAYRIEPLVNPQLQNVKPSLIPHHKGRKRMHLELKETMARVGADLKQKLLESIRSTWSSMWPAAAPPDHQLEKVVEEEIEKEQLEEESAKEEPVQPDVTPGDMLGRLNAGRRVDHVLQEAPFEMINEYLFAMGSHVCYWESEDVMLLMLREIYDSMGVQPDVTVPQQSLTVQRTTIVAGNETIVTDSPDPSTSRLS